METEEKKTVLLVDDEESILNLLAQLLEMFGHKVITAIDGANGIQILKENLSKSNSIDLVITDLKMPIIDGITMAQKIKSVVPDMQIIFMSGMIDQKTKASLQNLGFDLFLNKPVNLKELEDMVNLALSRPRFIAQE